MEFQKCKEKYFIIVEGEERATIRESLAAAEKKRQKLAKYSGGKKIIGKLLHPLFDLFCHFLRYVENYCSEVFRQCHNIKLSALSAYLIAEHQPSFAHFVTFPTEIEIQFRKVS